MTSWCTQTAKPHWLGSQKIFQFFRTSNSGDIATPNMKGGGEVSIATESTAFSKSCIEQQPEEDLWIREVKQSKVIIPEWSYYILILFAPFYIVHTFLLGESSWKPNVTKPMNIVQEVPGSLVEERLASWSKGVTL